MSETRYDAAISRAIARTPVLRRRVDQERGAGEEFFARFDSCSPGQQVVMVRNRRRYGRVVVDGLLARARVAAHHDAEECRRLAELALVALSQAALSVPGRESLAVSVRAEIANAQRVQGDLRGAALTWAFIDQLGDEWLDPLEAARLLSLRASFADARREHGTAVELLRRAVAIASEVAERMALARLLVQLAPILVRANDAEEGLRVAHEACRMLQPEDDGKLRLVALHNLAYCADELGEVGLAEHVLQESESLYAQFAGDLDRLRRDWMLARCRVARCELAVAEAQLERLAEEFGRRHMLYEHAMVGLDQLKIWIDQRRWEPVRQRAGLLVHVFGALGVEPGAIAALIALQQSTLRRAEALAMVLELTEAARAAERHPPSG